MHVLVNELSFQGQANNKHDAKNLMSDVINIIKACREIQESDPLTTSGQIWQSELLKDYTVCSWLNDVDRDTKAWFLTTVLRGPYIEELLSEYCPKHKSYYGTQNTT